MKTCELLDAVKLRYKLPSDYALAKFLGIRQQTISGYRHHDMQMDDEIALRVADKLGIEDGAVLAWMHAERTKCPRAAKAFRELARQCAGAFASIILGVSLLMPSSDVAAASVSSDFSFYTLCALLAAVKVRKFCKSRVKATEHRKGVEKWKLSVGAKNPVTISAAYRVAE